MISKAWQKKTTIGDFCFFFKLFFFSVSAKNAPTWPQFLCKCVTPFSACFFGDKIDKKKFKKKIPTVTGSSCSIYLTERKQKTIIVYSVRLMRGAAPAQVALRGRIRDTWIYEYFHSFILLCVSVISGAIFTLCADEKRLVCGAVSFDCVALLHPISQWVLFPFSFCCGHNA